ncbi:MAG: ATPase with chaperone activity, ATP-binding subunit [Deltaproteobacteria bacterium]|nr:ATPase with chaperone activity, ATP-binding subunit [Deltaproteobacteria bacterium]
MSTGKGLIRSLNRKGTRSEKKPAGAGRSRRPQEVTICERCGAVFSRQTWRRERAVTHALLARASWAVCPACKQARASEYYGRVLLRGAYAAANEAEIRRRIDNVVARAGFTQPQRKLVSVERSGDEIEVLTTSQKLARRPSARCRSRCDTRWWMLPSSPTLPALVPVRTSSPSSMVWMG